MILVLLLLLSGAAELDAADATAAPLDDRALVRRLENEGFKLLRAGRTGSNLHQRLDRAAARVTPLPESHLARTPADLYRTASASVVVLGEFYHCGKCSETHMGSATGFFITSDGALVTSRHVVSRTNTLGLVAMTQDGSILPVRDVLAAGRLSDLVVLQVEGLGFTPLPLSTNAPPGSPVTVLSHPDGHYYLLTSGMVARYSVDQRRRGASEWMTITAPFAKGSSGAPVMDASGNVVGIVNNTESIYYDTAARTQRDLQMVLHNCSPSAELLKLLAAPEAPQRPVSRR